jgi:hypothetical protein
VLHAYDATTLVELYNSNQASGGRDQFGIGNKFVAPTIANGKVYLGTASGVGVFGLLPPALVSLSPTSGGGTLATFTAVYSDSNGTSDLNVVHLLVNTTVGNGNACYLLYQPQGSHLYLANDAGDWIAPPLTPGMTGTVSNSQCALAAESTSVSTAGDELTLRVELSFSSTTFVGQQNVYLSAAGISGNTGWVKEGTWTPYVSTGPPAVVSLSPSSGGGTTVTFRAVYSDPNRAADLSVVHLLVNTGVSPINACYVLYQPQSNNLYLANNAGAWITPGLKLGVAGTVSNSQCALNTGTSSVSTAGNELTLNVTLSFSSTFVSPQNVYLQAEELSGVSSGFAEKGTWTP